MSEFDKKTLQHLQHLCRIRCNEEETEVFLENLKKILAHMEMLNQLDVEGIEPCCNVSNTFLPLREDQEEATLDRTEFLSNAPAHTGGLVRVPPILHKKGSDA